jgi:hypothetical protein
MKSNLENPFSLEIRFLHQNGSTKFCLCRPLSSKLVDSTLIDVLRSSQLLPLFWKRKTRSSLALVEKRLRARVPCSSSSLPCALSSPSNYLIPSDAAGNVRLQRLPTSSPSRSCWRARKRSSGRPSYTRRRLRGHRSGSIRRTVSLLRTPIRCGGSVSFDGAGGA